MEEIDGGCSSSVTVTGVDNSLSSVSTLSIFCFRLLSSNLERQMRRVMTV